MKAFAIHARAAIATLLAGALIVSGAVLSTPAAYADDEQAETAAVTPEASAATSSTETAPAVAGEEANDPDPGVTTPETALGEATTAPEAETTPQAAAQAEEAGSATLTPVPLSGDILGAPASRGARSVTSTEAPRDGGEITVSGTGFSPQYPGIYVGVGPAGLAGFYGGSTQMLDYVWVAPGNSAGTGNAGRTAPMQADGSFTLTFTLPAYQGTQYAIYTSKAHGLGATDPSQNVIAAVAYAAPPAPVWTPDFQVFAADGVTPIDSTTPVYNGDEIVIRGSGFDPNANVGGRGMPIPAHLPQGSYVVLGSFSPDWQPSTGAASAKRKAGAQGWVLAESVLNQVPSRFQGVIRGQWVSLADDGSWTARLTVGEITGGPADGRYGVYSYGAGGVSNASQELEFLLNYRGERPSYNPALSVFLADGTTAYTGQEVREGDKLIVRGTGFDPYANFGGIGQPIPTHLPQGTFIVFGSFAENWKPSAGVSSAQRSHDSRARGWLFAEDTVNSDPAYQAVLSQWVKLDPSDGSFEWEVTLSEPATPLQNGKWGIYSYAGGVNTANPAQELSVPLNYIPKNSQGGGGAPSGELKWGISDRFNNYIENIARGSITLLGAATRDGSVFGFSQTSGGAWDQTRQTGTAHYSGGVAYLAHHGALNLTIENPIVEVGADGVVLSARFNHGPQTPFVDVDLSQATKTVSAEGAVTWSGASTTLRPEAVSYFMGSYSAGMAFAPLTFTVDAPARPSVTVDAVQPVNDTLTIAASAQHLPGAAYAALIERGTESNIHPGGGYAALAVLPARPDGSAAFTMSVDKEKLDRSKEYELLIWRTRSMPSDPANIYTRADVQITEAMWDVLFGVPNTPSTPSTPLPTPAERKGAGSLSWGISSAFAAYTLGPIAKGDIHTLGVGHDGSGYLFPQARGGSWNDVTRTGTIHFSGRVTFTGHGGLMQETFANPVLTVSSPVAGTISVGGYTFPLNLAAAVFTENPDGTVTWSAVPVGGSIAGGGNGGGGSLAMDSLSFTVGVPSVANYGSTVRSSAAAQERTPAPAPPASTGLTVVTPPEKIIKGGEIEITASGFAPNERDILVVLYSEPIVLDNDARADANGVVRWIGTLPAELTGDHTITLQGSINVGQSIKILAEAPAQAGSVDEVEVQAVQAAGPLPDATSYAWVWWVAALLLIFLAALTTSLLVVQRRRAAASVQL